MGCGKVYRGHNDILYELEFTENPRVQSFSNTKVFEEINDCATERDFWQQFSFDFVVDWFLAQKDLMFTFTVSKKSDSSNEDFFSCGCRKQNCDLVISDYVKHAILNSRLYCVYAIQRTNLKKKRKMLREYLENCRADPENLAHVPSRLQGQGHKGYWY